ncbi:MAG: hypothetical protein A2W26_09845 [Acidobacteria bacterium RBG_16_64_8]|nr:MAG: hypothetical protein A2W26_09845 [Acidobacteria bacterium RBG_16_64_8]
MELRATTRRRWAVGSPRAQTNGTPFLKRKVPPVVRQREPAPRTKPSHVANRGFDEPPCPAPSNLHGGARAAERLHGQVFRDGHLPGLEAGAILPNPPFMLGAQP